MLKQLFAYLKEGFTYSGLEISESSKGELYYFLELKKSKGNLVISNKKELNSLNEIQEFVKKQTPLFLCINTKSVLTKRLKSLNSTDHNAIINEAFPNIDLQNFYYQIIQLKNQPIVTITRKEKVENLLKKVNDLTIKVSGFSLGISPIEEIISYLEFDAFHISNMRLLLIGDTIADIIPLKHTSKDSYSINGLDLTSTYLLPFSAIVSHINKKSIVSNFKEKTDTLKSEFQNNRIFNQVIKLTLIFFVTLLLVNFLFYSTYFNKVEELKTLVEATSAKKNQITSLKIIVNKKQERIEALNNSSNSKATFYLDMLAKNIPNSVLLNEIKYQPVAKAVRDSKPILVEHGVLLLSGISKDVNEFSIWLSAIEKYDWVSSAETLNYDYESKTTSNFIIEIDFQKANNTYYHKQKENEN